MASGLVPPFSELAAADDPRLDLLALALAREFREVDAADALATLDLLGAELLLAVREVEPTPRAIARACAQTLGGAYGFIGDPDEYDHPDNSMLDRVLARRRGLPILLSTVYVEAARRAGIALGSVGLPGHFVVAHFGVEPPLLLDPFSGGAEVVARAPRELVRPWRAHEVAMRMLNNLVGSFARRGDLGAAIRAASMRLALPADADERELLEGELRAMQARLN
jgi:regulator of sirC expression with transglutaminase-like and TPR domain